MKKKIRFLFAISLVLVFNCAFLNTYYNAQNAFNTANKKHRKLETRESNLLETIPLEIINGYDRSIEKSEKVVEVYPQKVRYHDDALWIKSKATFYKGDDYPLTIRRFLEFQQLFPQSPFIPESYLLLGQAYLKDNNVKRAEETFNYILNHYPRLNKREEITIFLADVSILREGKSQAIKILEKSLKGLRDGEKRIRVIVRLSALYMEMFLYDNAILLLESAPRGRNFQKFLFTVDYSLLICYSKKGRIKDALLLSVKMEKNIKYVAFLDKVLLQRAIIYEQSGQLDDAFDVYMKITESKNLIEEIAIAWFHLGNLYQKWKGDFENAKECFEHAERISSDDLLKDEVRERLDGMIDMLRLSLLLDSLSQWEKDLPDSVSDTIAKVSYKLAEIFWLGLQEPDSALLYFDRVVNDSSVDQNLYSKSLYAKGWILKNLKSDTVVADSIFTVLIDMYPASIVAKRSQQALGLLVTIKTREDSARMAYLLGEKYLYEKNDPVKAANIFYKVFKTYRNVDTVAEIALYASGWICDEILSRNIKARMLYKMFCDSFPSSPICSTTILPRLKVVDDSLRVRDLKNKSHKKIDLKRSGDIKPVNKNVSEGAVLEHNESDNPEDGKMHDMPSIVDRDSIDNYDEKKNPELMGPTP